MIDGKTRPDDMILIESTKAYEKGIDALRMSSDPGREPPTLHMLATAVRRKLHVEDGRKLPVVLLTITSGGAYYLGQIKITSGDKRLDNEVFAILPDLHFALPPTREITYSFLFDLNAPERLPLQQSRYATSKCVVMSNRPAEIDEYILDIRNRIQASWHNDLPYSPCIQLNLKANGKVANLKILRSTGSADRDAAAKSTISAITFAPIPWFVRGDFLTFDINLGTLAEIKSQPDKGRTLRLAGNGFCFSSGSCGEPNKEESSPFMSNLQARIRKHWTQPAGSELKRVVVRFKVHKGGEMSDLRIEQSSGALPADEAALKAIEHAAPFKPLPSDSPETVDIRCVFDKNAVSTEKIN